MADSTMSREVMVFAMRLISCLVPRVSATTIFVPSDLMTRSKGVIMKAKGKLLQTLAMGVSP